MERNHEEIWRRCLLVIRDNIPEPSYNTWFKPIVPISLERNVLTIRVPSMFFYEYIEEQFIDLLKKTLRKELGPDAKLEYNVVVDQSTNTPTTVKYPTTTSVALKNRPISTTSNVPADAGAKSPFVLPGTRKTNIDPRLNAASSFDNFVEGESNRLARATAYAVASKPGSTSFNPYMVYGDSGLGKTHLAQAIGIEVKERMPEKVVLYVSANEFQNQYTDASRKNIRNDFVYFYQSIDILIIDDVHEFANKAGTQESFFHIFNHFHQNGKQLILTCDKAPSALEGLESRLLSRFKWGLSVEIQSPDFLTRKEILKRKIYNDGIIINEDILDYMASTVTTNVRELEGVLISLMAHTTFVKRELTLDLARNIIENIIKNSKKDITVDDILVEVARHYNMEPEMLQLRKRKSGVVLPRQVAMYLTKKHTNMSVKAIGQRIGGLDHSTVLHGCKQVENYIFSDKKFRKSVETIEEKLSR